MKIKILITTAAIFLLYIIYSIINNSHYAKANKFNAKGIFDSKNDFAESDLDFKKAISYKFREHIPLTNLGINSIRNRDFSLAHDYFEKALREKKDYIPAKYNDAIALFEWGKDEYNPEKCNIGRVMIFWNQSQSKFQEIANADVSFQFDKESLADKSRENSELISLYIEELKNGCKPLKNQNKKEEEKNSEHSQSEDENKKAESEKENSGDENKEKKNDSGKREKENLSQSPKSERSNSQASEKDNSQKMSDSDEKSRQGKKPNAPNTDSSKNQGRNTPIQNKPIDRDRKKSEEDSGFKKFADWLKRTLDQPADKKNKTSESEKENSGDGHKENLSQNSMPGKNKNQASKKDNSQNLHNSDKNNRQGKVPNVPNEDSSENANLANLQTDRQQNQDQNKNKKSPKNGENSTSKNSKSKSENEEAPNSNSPNHHLDEDNQKNLNESETLTEHLEHEYGKKKLTEKEKIGLDKELERIQKSSYKQKYYRTRLEKSEKDRSTEETRKLLKEALW